MFLFSILAGEALWRKWLLRGKGEKPTFRYLGTTPPSGTERAGRAVHLAEMHTLLHWPPLALPHLSPNVFSAYCSPGS